MRIRPAYIPIGGAWPFAGIDAESPPVLASPKSALISNNIDYLRGYISKRAGYVTIGGQFQHGTVAQTGSILAISQYQSLAGVTTTVALNANRQFRYNVNTALWVDITPGTPPANWTGTETNGIYLITGTDQNGRWIYATNGVNTPRRWGGGTGNFADIPCNIPSFVTCKTFAVYGSSLVIANVSSAGREPQTIYWSDTTNFGEFLTGNSGAVLLPDTRGDIVRLEVLGDRLVVYAEDSIGVATYVGGTALFAFETLATDTRLLGGRAVCSVGLLHFFMGRENIFAFDGTRGIRPIGNPIRPLYRNAIELSLAALAFAFNDSNDNRAWFVIPTSDTTSTAFIYEYDKTNPTQGSWAQHNYSEPPRSMGYFSAASDPLWSASTGTWLARAGTWASIATRAGFPNIVMGQGGFVRILDGTSFSDAGAAVSASWESVDFTVPGDWPGSLGRWELAEVEAKGSLLLMSYSVDRGLTWSAPQVFYLTTTPAYYRLFIDATGDSCRIRITAGGATDFTVNGLRIGVRYAGIG